MNRSCLRHESERSSVVAAPAYPYTKQDNFNRRQMHHHIHFPVGHDPRCTHCGQSLENSPCHDYMLTEEAWARLHPEGHAGFLHDRCLVARANALGRTLTAEDFTECLCFVNRHIHLPTPVAVLAKIAERHEKTRVHRALQGKNVPQHYASMAATILQGIASQDLHMQKGTDASAFSDLFRSDMLKLGGPSAAKRVLR